MAIVVGLSFALGVFDPLRLALVFLLVLKG